MRLKNRNIVQEGPTFITINISHLIMFVAVNAELLKNDFLIELIFKM